MSSVKQEVSANMQSNGSATAVFGSRIKEMRLIRNLTQEQLSVISGIGQGDISKLERGIRKGNLKNAIALAKALNTTIDYLIGATDQKERW